MPLPTSPWYSHTKQLRIAPHSSLSLQCHQITRPIFFSETNEISRMIVSHKSVLRLLLPHGGKSLTPSPFSIPAFWYTFKIILETLFSNALIFVAFQYQARITASGITDMIHLKKQVASFLLARLGPESSRATCCIINWYICRQLSPNFNLSHDFRSSNATPVKHN